MQNKGRAVTKNDGRVGRVGRDGGMHSMGWKRTMAGCKEVVWSWREEVWDRRGEEGLVQGGVVSVLLHLRRGDDSADKAMQSTANSDEDGDGGGWGMMFCPLSNN